MSEPHDIPGLVSEVLTSKHLSHDLLVQLGRLLIADATFNGWCATLKRQPVSAPAASSAALDPSHAERISHPRYDWLRDLDARDQAWLAMLEDAEDIFIACSMAWKTFRSAAWPREDFDEWQRQRATFHAVLDSCTVRIESLGRALGRGDAR